MKKSLLFFISLMVLASCQNDVTLAEQDPASVEAESRYNANELRAIGTAKSFISSFASTTRSGEAKEVGDVYPWLSSDLFPATTRSASDELPDTLLYIVNFKDSEGYVLVHSQDSIGSILAYVEEGHLAPTDDIDPESGFSFFLDRLQYLRPDPLNPFPDDSTNLHGPDPVNPFNPDPPIPEEIGNWRVDSIIPYLVQTKWGQKTPYSDFCFTNTGAQALAGCVPVALAQVVAFHQFPSSACGHTYYWSDILSGTSPQTSTGRTSVAHLVHDIGVLAGTTYGVESSGTTESGKANCLNALGYHYSYSPYSFSTCMQEFASGRPVVIGGYDSQLHNYAGHCWVVDGGLIRGYYEPRASLEGEGTGTVMVRSDEQLLIHCNWGADGKYNGYFLSDNFELANKVLDDNLGEPTDSVTENYNFDFYIRIFHEIYPQTNN